MIDKDLNSSVQDEQFGKTENTQSELNASNADEKAGETEETGAPDAVESDTPKDITELDSVVEVVKDEVSATKTEESSDEIERNALPVEEAVSQEEPEVVKDEEPAEAVVKAAPEIDEEEKPEPESEVVAEKSTSPVEAEGVKDDSSEEKSQEQEVKDSKEGSAEQTAEKSDDSPSDDKVSEEAKKEKDIEPLSLADAGYEKMDQEVLVASLHTLLDNFKLHQIKDHIEAIKSIFYKNLNIEIEKKKEAFIESGSQAEDFKVEESPLESELKELLLKYRNLRSEFNKNQDEVKKQNLAEKYRIIENIKDLINSQESLNHTFHEFRDLQDKWRLIGPVPQQNVKGLWESYHYQVEAFYDYIKINKELRDLDLKKNLESKIVLCEKAEELIIEPSVVEAFKQLQLLHDQWREIGPVSPDKRTEIWERFKDATSKINHRHQEYFVKLKQEQKNNLDEKTLLCEKVEEISESEIKNSKDWEGKSKQIIELQRVWKSIGFAPKKHNAKIYERFRKACDTFFNRKRDFFAQNREEQQNNLQLKTELCMQAEALQDSTDWKKTSNDLIKLQKRWKEIGSVPPKVSEKVWHRFRAACDKFFNSKSAYYNQMDSRYDDNLKDKEALIEEIKNFKPGEDNKENISQLKQFQRKWSEIGFVPIKKKDEIQDLYRDVINSKFDELQLDEEKKSILKFRTRVEGINTKPNADKRLNMERDKCYNKMKQLESDILLWENNIGFFSNSKNASSMIEDVQNKIDDAKQKIEALKEKINIIDEMDEE